MKPKKRLRFLSLLGEGVHAWLTNADRIHWLNTAPLVETAAELDELMRVEQPSLWRTLRDLGDDDLLHVWRYARSRNIVHEIAHIQPSRRLK